MSELQSMPPKRPRLDPTVVAALIVAGGALAVEIISLVFR
jgi:hypothetical protein